MPIILRLSCLNPRINEAVPLAATAFDPFNPPVFRYYGFNLDYSEVCLLFSLSHLFPLYHTKEIMPRKFGKTRHKRHKINTYLKY